MKTKNIVLLLTVVLSFNIALGIVVGQTETGTVTTPGTIITQPIPSDIIVDSDNYIKSLVGGEYFSKNFKLTGNVTMQSGTGEISYIISYLYDMNLPEGYLIRETPIHVAVTLEKDGNIKEYLGPKKPHTFAIKKEQVIETAKNNGLKEPIGAGIDRILTSGSIDGYVWVATGAIDDTNCKVVGGTKECNIPGIYIDVDNGSIISKFNSSSLIKNPSPVSTPGPTETQPIETPAGTQTTKSPFIGGLATFIILLIVAFLVRHRYKN